MGSSLFGFYRQIFCSFWGKVPYQALVVSIAGFTGSMLAKFKHITLNGTRIDASHSIQYDTRCSCKSCCWCLQFTIDTIAARGSDPIWRIFEQTGWILPTYGSQDYESIRHPNIQGGHPPWSGKANPLNPYDVDGWEIPNKHLRCIKPLVNNGINYQPQLVPDFWNINSTFRTPATSTEAWAAMQIPQKFVQALFWDKARFPWRRLGRPLESVEAQRKTRRRTP